METKAKLNIPGWQWIIATVVFFIAVLSLQQYILFDIEQARVFLYQSDKILTEMSRVGGIADCIALFLQQFFLFNIAGAAIMAVLFVILSICVDKIYRYAVGRKTSLAENLLCCFPAALLFSYTEGEIFFITGHIAILMSVLGMLVGAVIINRQNIYLSVLLVPLVFFIGFGASTAVWPMVAMLILYALLYKRAYVAAGVTALSAVSMVAIARYTCIAVTNTELFSPDIYSYRTNTQTIMPWIWASLILLTIIPFIVKKYISDKVINHIALACTTAIVLCLTAYKVYQSEHDDASCERFALQRWVDTKNYAPAYDFCMEYLGNIYTANIYFMMYSEEGSLENEVGGILRDGRQLIMPTSKARLVRRLLMSLYYYIGYVNGAQHEAFEYNEPSEGMIVPAAVKILALTNIIQGNYAVADKYLTYLDNTLFYRDWAKQYRKFLYNDKAVENDAELGPRRKSMNIESIPETKTTIPNIIRQISEVAPELPATNYKKAYIRLGEYNKSTYETSQQSFIAY